MALADLMKKGFLTSATATVATPATHSRENTTTVATVAGVAVANDWKYKTPAPTVATVAGVAVAKLSKTEITKPQDQTEQLALFRFDLMQDEIAAGQSDDELQRVNNMAWEFMQADGMAFDEAVTIAAQIVIDGQKAACEAAYIDVMALFKRLENQN